ncbi:Outer membrane protein TolC [Sporomusa carbonis]|uniref:TolC family protein n=1 Tax=Sporomusa carbonis TaxID=3076075 RepID=UPI003A692FB2
MPGKKNLLKPAVTALTTGVLLLNSAAVFAAPTMLSLDESVAITLKNSSAIKIADADKEKAAWGRKEAEAGKMPTLSLGSTYNLNQSGGGGSHLNNSLRFSWPLYTGGKLEGQIEQAKQSQKIADLGVDKAKQQAKLDATIAYYDVLEARSIVETNQAAVSNLEAHLKNVQAQYGAGVVAKSDVLRSEVELSNAEQNLIKAKNSYDLAVANLNNIMNIDIGTEVALKDELRHDKYDKSLEESIALALKNRPEIAQAQAGVDSANAAVKVAAGGKLPTVSLGGSTGWSDSVLPDSNNNWSMSLTASWNVFDAGVTNAKIKQADTTVTKAAEQYEQTKDNIELEVRQAYLSMQEADKRLATTEMAVNKAEEDLYIAQEKYKAGAGTNLDVIDANLSLTQAKTNHIQALYDYNVSMAKLDKAIGTQVN